MTNHSRSIALPHPQEVPPMVRFTALSALALAAATCLMLGAGCSRSPEAKKAQHLERGEKFFARKDYKEAVIEYRNVLRLEPANEVAIRRLGLAHYQAGELNEAFPYLRKAAELDPRNEDVNLKLATVYLVGRRPDDARPLVASVLEQDSKNFDALMLLADSASKPEDVDAALLRLENARSQFQDRPQFHIALGTLFLKKRDAAKAEQAFKEAVARDPKSVQAHTALAQYYGLVGNLARTEEELKAAAELSPNGSPARMQLADFYIRTGKRDAAKAVLTDITTKDKDYLPAWRRLAEIALAEGQYDDSLAKLAPVFKKNGSDIEGLLVRGRVHLAKHETLEAIADFQAVLKLEPKLPIAHQQLALAHLQANNLQQAKAELSQAITLAPQFVDARLLLAQINLQSGSAQAAIEDLENLTRTMPRVREPYRILGTAYLNQKAPAKATETFRKFAELNPRDATGPYLIGIGLRAEGKVAEARKQFEAALALAPGALEPTVQLVNLKLADKDQAGAIELAKQQIAATKTPGPLYELLANVYVLQGKTDDAEKAFLKAIELEPRLTASYTGLATIYARQKKLDEGIAKLEQAHKIAPTSLPPLMMLGILQQQRGNIAKAQEAYTQVLSINPRFAPAANNLAWIYSENTGDKDKALQLAQTAKEAAPDDPRVSDTLGWILYKRGVYQRALALFEESAAKISDEPTIQYHLGMAYSKVGNKEGARKALTAATSAKREFPELADARRALSELN
jgi:putative PEP-CTERM system TPR-repeat lipoprotein